ncbi:uncharacterized protein LOC144095602 [Amblyomma americanum]
MVNLAKKLNEVQGISHAMYADDITIWTTEGPLGDKQEVLQKAAACIEEYTQQRGLRCSTEKSELLRVGRHPTDAPHEVKLEGQNIPEQKIIRILGTWLQGSRRCSHTLCLLSRAAGQVGRMINRVAHERYGMKEEGTLRLVNSLVVSRVTYSLPYHVTIKAEREQAEAILRKAYKTALHLPRNTSNDKLMHLGISNTFEELKECQLKAQARRLSNTTRGRALLTELG